MLLLLNFLISEDEIILIEFVGRFKQNVVNLRMILVKYL